MSLANFLILQEGQMINGVVPGTLAKFQAVPVDASGKPAAMPSGASPSWQSSDPTNASVSMDANVPSGLACSVNVNPTAPTSGTFTLTFSITEASGKVISASATVPFLAQPVTGFQINQTS